MHRPKSFASILLVLAVASVAAAARGGEDGGRLDGEYGLWVRWQGDTIAVSWITAVAMPGFIEAQANGQRVHSEETPADSAHTAIFAVPRGAPLTLRYGARGGTGGGTDVHETVIMPRGENRRARTTWSAPDSLIVVSDIHGEFDRLTRVLRNAGVIDASLRWTGGHRHLVVVGDVFDRGEDATRALWFLYGLEPQAEAAGGRLHMVLGNHEIMVMTGDLRYVAPKEMTIALLHGTSYDRLFDPHTSVLGRWLVEKPAMVRIGDVLFAHGGVSADYLSWTLNSFEDSLTAYTNEELFRRWSDSTYVAPLDSAGVARRNEFFWGPRSVFWYREYVQSDSAGAALRNVMARFGAKLAVVGHTPQPTITQRHDGMLIDVNTQPFINEALLLVKARDGWARYRVGETGAPSPLPPSTRVR